MRFWSLLVLANTGIVIVASHTLGPHLLLVASCFIAPVLLANLLLIDRRNQLAPSPQPPGLDVGLDILDPRDDGNPFAWTSGRHART